MVTGVLLSVFGRRRQRIATRTATVGIRGTGVYVESDPDESYICTCYGTADLIPIDATEPEETVVSEHHDAPRYALRSGSSGKYLRVAPFKNHTDMEVALIEELVGRVNSDTSAVSIARMKSPSGWLEPGQTPEFDEYTVVLRGCLHVKLKDTAFDVGAGQAITVKAGEWVQYSSPSPEGAEYIAVCIPAFSPETVHRE